MKPIQAWLEKNIPRLYIEKVEDLRGKICTSIDTDSKEENIEHKSSLKTFNERCNLCCKKRIHTSMHLR